MTKLFALEGLLIFVLNQCAYSPVKVNQDETDIEVEVVGIEKEEAKEKRDVIAPLKLGIEQTKLYRKELLDKKVGVVSNQTGMINDIHLVDTLLSMGIQVTKVFAPEHGFRGKADAGAHISSTTDAKTGLPIMSLYGETKKPSVEMMSGLDVIVYDIQDVGVRFYTYISTLHYVMEACAEAGIPLFVLDRPNPNAHYIDGPVLEKEQTSFVGMHPVPVVYGMTIGEYGKMINGEGWLPNNLKCELRVIPMKGYWHGRKYSLPIPPSPNLRTDESIQLYPSLCFFEGTSVSVGRGTETPFEIYGHPNFPQTDFSFTPKSVEGASSPLLENKLCNGYNLHEAGKKRMLKLDLSYFIEAQNLLLGKATFMTNTTFFHKLAGNTTLLTQIQSGMSEEEIRKTWQKELDAFKLVRAKYLVYQ
jgi:uncharacterized protein YbbC (DUF1343 family)